MDEDNNAAAPAEGEDQAVNERGPEYYKGADGAQVWDLYARYGLDGYLAQAVGYIMREKPGQDRATDLRKAAHFVEKRGTIECMCVVALSVPDLALSVPDLAATRTDIMRAFAASERQASAVADCAEIAAMATRTDSVAVSCDRLAAELHQWAADVDHAAGE